MNSKHSCVCVFTVNVPLTKFQFKKLLLGTKVRELGYKVGTLRAKN